MVATRRSSGKFIDVELSDNGKNYKKLSLLKNNERQLHGHHKKVKRMRSKKHLQCW